MVADVISSAPGGSITIQGATWRDLGEIRQLEKLCFPLDSWPLLDMLGVLSFPSVERIKAVSGEKIVGFVAADIRSSKDLAWIATICVHPEHQGKGFGSQLLEACEQALNISTIKLSVRSSNDAAIRLYKKFGYNIVETWPKYYKGGEDATVMEKTIA